MIKALQRRAGASLRHPRRQPVVTLPFALLAALFLATIILPLGALSLQALTTPRQLHESLADASVRQAILLSFEAGGLAALLAGLLGIPLAWLLSRCPFPGRSIVQTIVDLPLTIPHVVAGIAILFVYGRRGLLGAPLHHVFGLSFWGTLPGIVVAMLFVSAPYTVSAARIAFDGVDARLEMVSRSLGVGPWRTLWRVVIPLCWRGLVSAMTLSYARAVSEFGAVVLVAYYPMTSPVKIYNLFLSYGLPQAISMSFIVLLVTLCVFLILRLATHRRQTPP